MELEIIMLNELSQVQKHKDHMFSLSPSEMTSTGFNVPYSYMYRKYIDHIHPSLSSLPSSTLPL
jgi:hypothetical protein